MADEENYIYDELLGRVFNILRENNPELAGNFPRIVLPPPQVLREGTRKTIFVNFVDLCLIIHRQHEHVQSFLLAELGTTGSIDGQQRLVVKGRFAPKNFERIPRCYLNEYVICNGCKNANTIISKENRLSFLRCENLKLEIKRLKEKNMKLKDQKMKFMQSVYKMVILLVIGHVAVLYLLK